jgi:hypothetical protein
VFVVVAEVVVVVLVVVVVVVFFALAAVALVAAAHKFSMCTTKFEWVRHKYLRCHQYFFKCGGRA